jgi:hypothetical protein
VINERAAPPFWGFDLFEVQSSDFALLGLGLKHQGILPFLTKLVEFRTNMKTFDEILRAVRC